MLICPTVYPWCYSFLYREGRGPGRKRHESLCFKRPLTNHTNSFAHDCWPPWASLDLFASGNLFSNVKDTPDAATLTLHALRYLTNPKLWTLHFWTLSKLFFWVCYLSPFLPYHIQKTPIGLLHFTRMYSPTVGALNAESPENTIFPKCKKILLSENKCLT